MAINKVVYGTDTLMDITDTTATSEDVANGKVFYSASGIRAVGTASGGLPVLTSPVYVDQLTPGLYKLPAGCIVYDDPELLTGISEINNGGLLYVDTIEDTGESGHNAYAITIINDNSDYEYNEGSPASYGDIFYQYGIIAPDTGDYWALGQYSLNRCVTKIKLNNQTIYGSDGVASIYTEGTYNQSSNKLVTKNYCVPRVVNVTSAQKELSSAILNNGSSIIISSVNNTDQTGAILGMSPGNITFSGGASGTDNIQIHGVATPTNNTDAVNKKYVDDLVGDIESLLGGI